MSTRSGRIRQSNIDSSPSRTRKEISPSSSSRIQKSSPKRSPSRRSPSRRSPSRKSSSNYPARKSPSRSVKNIKAEKESENIYIPRSPSKRQNIKKAAEVRLHDIAPKIDSFRSTRSRRIEYSVKDVAETTKTSSDFDEKLNGLEIPDTTTELYNLRNRKTIDEGILRRSSKLRELNPPDIRRSFTKSLSKSVSKSISQSLDTYSDEDNSDEIVKRKSESHIRKLSTPLPGIYTQLNSYLEFGGRIGSGALIILIPLVAFSLLLTCKASCSYENLIKPLSYESSVWFNTTASVLITAQYAIQAIFVLIPMLRSKEEPKEDRRYSFNGFFCGFSTTLIVTLLYYYEKLNTDILDWSLQMALQSFIISVILSCILYFKKTDSEDNFNPYGNSLYYVYNFFMGKEIRPTLMKINVKLWVSRVCNISALILSILVFKRGIYFQESIQKITLEELSKLPNKITLNPTILIFSLMQIIYSLYFIWGEHKITSTFYWQYEGMGYMQLVSSACYPYYFITVSKHITNAELTLPRNILIAAPIIFVLGYLIMLISNNIKYEFRKNPLHPSLTHLDCMPTFHGKKILVSNLWGIVRHPNYTGDILIQISFALPGIYSRNIVAAAPALLTILVLIHRCWRDHGRCKRRYGAAWQRYCKRVPSAIIPKIF